MAALPQSESFDPHRSSSSVFAVKIESLVDSERESPFVVTVRGQVEHTHEVACPRQLLPYRLAQRG